MKSLHADQEKRPSALLNPDESTPEFSQLREALLHQRHNGGERENLRRRMRSACSRIYWDRLCAAAWESTA